MSSVIVHAAIAPCLAQPSTRSEQVTQLVLGETGNVVERRGEWWRVRTFFDGYDGWVHSGYVSKVSDADADDWRAQATAWSEGASVRIEGTVVRLPLRARVGLEEDFVVLPNLRRGKVVAGCVRELADVVSAARSKSPERWAFEYFQGSPYQWGGVTPWGVDCSGLVQTTFAARDVPLPRDSAQQATQGKALEPDAALPGDLLFFRSESSDAITHVAFAGEADTLVHSTLACGGVLVEPWGPGTRAAQLRERLVAARRLEDR